MKMLINTFVGLAGVMLIFNNRITLGSEVQAKQGTLIGLVTEKSTGKPLQGVRVDLVGTIVNALSDADGKFQLREIPMKSYSVKFSLTGFAELKVLSVTPRPGDTLKVELESSLVQTQDTSTARLCKEARERAVKDTTGARLVHILRGGFANPDSATQRKMADITRRYGFETLYGGCVQPCWNEYNAIIYQWLDKRNGKGWRKEIENLYRKMK